jgi:hypothetical protein
MITIPHTKQTREQSECGLGGFDRVDVIPVVPGRSNQSVLGGFIKENNSSTVFWAASRTSRVSEVPKILT